MEESFRESANVLLNVFTFGHFSLVKKSQIFANTGEESHVALDKFTEEIEKREEQFKDILGFWHSHPVGAEFISSIDTATARAFSFSYGKRILMIIETDSGWHQAWYVDEDEIVANAKLIKIPWFDYFLVWIP